MVLAGLVVPAWTVVIGLVRWCRLVSLTPVGRRGRWPAWRAARPARHQRAADESFARYELDVTNESSSGMDEHFPLLTTVTPARPGPR
ncbi:hypothetical protein AB0H57_22565 [Micromonospora sp. NPDC050686]|uniref:hypothetical protein n=1 Tax=Micromonospora sp. NPDC050686 TaxID=3154631 RepID=UPI0033FB442D